jgi:hypothetical protein
VVFREQLSPRMSPSFAMVLWSANLMKVVLVGYMHWWAAYLSKTKAFLMEIEKVGACAREIRKKAF